MRTAETILELIRERGKKGLPLERVYKLLFNKDLYLKAYGKIYRNKGAMTHGVTEETPDGMSLEKIDAIIEALRYERYQWLPARRTYIPKKRDALVGTSTDETGSKWSTIPTGRVSSAERSFF